MRYIYALADPRTYQVRYIGQTSRSLLVRHQEHSTIQHSKNHRSYWLNQLHFLNLKPLMLVIEECDEFEWGSREQYWITYYQVLGCNLVNETAGGEGIVGYKHTEESLQKMKLPRLQSRETRIRRSVGQLGNRKALGYKHTENAKQKISDGVRGTKHHFVKLTEKDVLSIRKELNAGIKGVELATRYNVTAKTISKIKLNQRWKHIKEDTHD